MTEVSLLRHAIAAHGGSDQWSRIARVRLRVRIGGNILAFRFASPRVRQLDCVIDTRRVHASLRPFPGPGFVGVFEANRVSIETGEGLVVDTRAITRDAAGQVPRRLVWGDLDVLYFLGYALWNYTVTPYLFTWPGFECTEGPVWRDGDGAAWRTLRVRYPRAFATHCQDQTFYFDEAGLLRRLDYTADVFGPLARGAHMCDAHRTFDGCVFPTHRVVHPRRANGHLVRSVRVMEGWVDDIAFE